MRKVTGKLGTKKAAGFTLIELMIVIAVIGILAAILVPNYLSAKDRAALRACDGALSNVKTTIEIIRTDGDISGSDICGAGTTIGDCLVDEMIGVDATFDVTNLEQRISSSCYAKGGGTDAWTAAMIEIEDSTSYKVWGGSRGVITKCDVCISETSSGPSTFAKCQAGDTSECL
ncbi:MAG: type II secretion system protein [bacterium]